MEVTKNNFKDELQDIQITIENSTFIAFDAEFTGLLDGKRIGPYDTTYEYYKKHRDSMNFLLIQFGLCAFKYDIGAKTWSHKCYNFYIFRGLNIPSLFKGSTMKFLRSNGFSFDKLFDEGISYLSKTEEATARKLLQKVKDKTRKECERVPTVEEVCGQVEELVKYGEEEDVLRFEVPDEDAARDLCQTIRERFSDDVDVQFDRPADCGITPSREEQEKDQTLEDAIGFSLVVRMLSESGKLIVGHNMIFDLCHTVHQFCDPLPHRYDDFKKTVHDLFPRLVDTKYIANCEEFKPLIKSTALAPLFHTLEQEPFSIPDVAVDPTGMGYTKTSAKDHEAGYDAFVTGLCLIAMSNHLDTKSQHPDVESLPALKPFMNKIFMMGIQDNGHINLTGRDPVLPRGHVFHVSFQRGQERTPQDIGILFKKFGKVFIWWLDRRSAYVALEQRQKASSVVATFSRSRDVTVLTYADYQASRRRRPQNSARKVINLPVEEPEASGRRDSDIDDEEDEEDDYEEDDDEDDDDDDGRPPLKRSRLTQTDPKRGRTTTRHKSR